MVRKFVQKFSVDVLIFFFLTFVDVGLYFCVTMWDGSSQPQSQDDGVWLHLCGSWEGESRPENGGEMTMWKECQFTFDGSKALLGHGNSIFKGVSYSFSLEGRVDYTTNSFTFVKTHTERRFTPVTYVGSFDPDRLRLSGKYPLGRLSMRRVGPITSGVAGGELSASIWRREIVRRQGLWGGFSERVLSQSSKPSRTEWKSTDLTIDWCIRPLGLGSPRFYGDSNGETGGGGNGSGEEGGGSKSEGSGGTSTLVDVRLHGEGISIFQDKEFAFVLDGSIKASTLKGVLVKTLL